MGAYTDTAQVWFPDDADTSKLDVLLATMASSIEDGLGARMTQQELNKGLLVSLSSTYMLPAASALGVVPYTVGSPGYNNGVTLSAGVATIVTPGLYAMQVNLFGYQHNGYVQALLELNGTSLSEALMPTASNNGGSYFFSGTMSATMVLNAGDAIRVRAASFNKTDDSPNAPQLFGASGRMLNTMAVTLLKAS
jgi:hypothetical protein